MMYKPHKTPFIKSPLGLALVALVALGGLFAILELTNTTHIFHNERKASSERVTAGQSTKGEVTNTQTSSNASNTSQDSTSTSQPGDSKENPTSTTNLVAPLGNFVSAHKNVPGSAALSSVCNTTAGAKCQITFTANGVTRSLPAQITDRGGATYWNSWTPDGIGLTSGSWQVQAIATLNGQTKISNDAMNLEIQ